MDGGGGKGVVWVSNRVGQNNILEFRSTAPANALSPTRGRIAIRPYKEKNCFAISWINLASHRKKSKKSLKKHLLDQEGWWNRIGMGFSTCWART